LGQALGEFIEFVVYTSLSFCGLVLVRCCSLRAAVKWAASAQPAGVADFSGADEAEPAPIVAVAATAHRAAPGWPARATAGPTAAISVAASPTTALVVGSAPGSIRATLAAGCLRLIRQPEAGQRHASEADAEFL